MLTSRSLVQAAALLAFGAASAAAQARLLDEGTFVITQGGAPSRTESFRIRSDNGAILATGQVIAGSRRVNSALTTDTLGTPLDYKVDVRENGASTMSISAVGRSGRLTTKSQLSHGDESTREYPIVPGSCLILDDDLLHQTYFLLLAKGGAGLQVINPRAARGTTVSLKARGLEPITVAGHQVTATHYSLVNGSSGREFWVDAAGRVLQIEIPSLNLKATRDDLPR